MLALALGAVLAIGGAPVASAIGRGAADDTVSPRAPASPRGRTTLYVHTLNLNKWVMNKAAGETVPFYDERALPAAVAALADPTAHSIVALTRQPTEAELAALFRSLPEDQREAARARLTVVCIPLASGKNLLQTLRRRPAARGPLQGAVAAAKTRGDELRLSAYSVDSDLAGLGGLLGVPILGATPQQRRLGTKAEARRRFDQAEVDHLEGSFEPLRHTAAIVSAVSEYVQGHPRRKRVVIKHDDGASGQGIAFLRIAGLSLLTPNRRKAEIERRLQDPRQLIFAGDRHKPDDDPTRETWASFEGQVAKVGVVVEEYVARPVELSVQLVIHPDGRVEVESCHRQLTRDGHYLGCEQPVEPALAGRLAAIGAAVGDELARAGVVGPVGIDVLGQRRRGADGRSELVLKACEVNLRTPATRYAAQLAKGVTGAQCVNGLLRTQGGGVVVYRQTDNLDRAALGDALAQLTPESLLALLEQNNLLYDPARGDGIVPTLLGALTVRDPRQRKFGAAFVATSASDQPAALRAAERRVRELQRQLRRALQGG